MSELKPCPFCGSEAEINEFYPSKFAIGCITQGCCAYWSSTPMFDTEQEATEAWNTRAERTCRNLGDFCSFECSECGATVDGGDETGVLTWPEVDGCRVFNYCPNCKRKVVDDE